MKWQNADSNEPENPPTGRSDVLEILNRVRGVPESEKFIFDSAALSDVESVDHAPSIELPKEIGRFKIRSILGHGGYGVVLLAFDPRLKREVALKVPRAEAILTDDSRARFLHEAEAAAALSHPNIVPVFESGCAGAIHYIASKYCPGITLAQWLNDPDREVIEPTQAARLVATLAEAVQHAHDRGVLHRDLKPANVLLERGESDESDEIENTLSADRVRLTDFGLARLQNSVKDVTRSGSILGTPSYMSPEQAEGRLNDVAEPSDIYTLGAMLYELLTGDPPFHGRSLLGTLDAVRGEEPKSPRKFNPAVPRDLAAVCLKCLEKEPSRRYQSGHELQRDLDRFLSGRSVQARPSTSVEKLVRWTRRNPLVSGLSLATLALFICLATGTSIAALALSKSNRQSLENLETAIKATENAEEQELLALKTVFEARLARARAGINSRRVGQRVESLKALRRAADQIERLGYGEAEKVELRREAIACMSLTDLELERQWPIDHFNTRSFSIDADVTQYAACEDLTTVVIRRMLDNSEVTTIDVPGAREIRPHLSPNGQWIALRFLDDENVRHLEVWNIAENERRLSRKIQSYPARLFDFSPDSDSLILLRADRTIELIDLVEMKTMREFQRPGEGALRSLRWNADGSRLAMVRDDRVEIWSVADQKLIQSIASDSTFVGLDNCATDFSADGKSIAAACRDNIVRVWDIPTGELLQELEGHGSEVTRIDFHPGGSYLATGSYDYTTRIWRLTDGAELLQAPETCANFSRDGRSLGCGAGRWKFHDPDPFLKKFALRCVHLHPNGRIAIDIDADDEVRLIDISSGKVLPVRLGKGTAMFSDDGKNLIVVRYESEDRQRVLYRLPIEFSQTDETAGVRTAGDIASVGEIHLHIGPPRRLASTHGGETSYRIGGDKLAICSRAGHGQILDMTTGKITDFSHFHRRIHSVDMSSDQRLIATATWHGRDAIIWDGDLGRRLAKIDVGNATVLFRPKSRTLVVSDNSKYRFLSVDRLGAPDPPKIEKKRHGRPGRMRYSADGKVFAGTTDQRTVRLYDGDSLTELATLSFRANDSITMLKFSEDASTLLVRSTRGTYVCDLWNIRSELRVIGLDWSGDSLPEKRPLRMIVSDSSDLGDLASEQSVMSLGSLDGGMVTASSHYSDSFPPENAFDGNDSRWHSSRYDMAGAWIGMEWNEARTIERVTLHQVYDRIRGFRLQGKVGGESEWRDLFVAEGKDFEAVRANALNSETAKGKRPELPMSCELSAPENVSAIRVLVTDTVRMTGGNVSIREIVVE